MPEELPLRGQLAYAVGQLGWAAVFGIVSLQLVYFYIPPKDELTGVPVLPIHVTQTAWGRVLNVITITTTAGRLWDAITDPVIAWMSDRMNHKRGRRIPCLCLGGLPCAVCCVLLFVPPVPYESNLNILWLCVMQILFFLFLTMYCTPIFALLPELGHTDNNTRTTTH